MREALANVGAFVAEHPDPVDEAIPDPRSEGGYASRDEDGDLPAQSGKPLNPDIAHFAVTSSPVMVLTGVEDISEPLGSGWRDFQLLATREKAFVDVMGATHMEVVQEHGKTLWLVNCC